MQEGLEEEGWSSSVTHPLGLGEVAKPRHTGQASQRGCLDHKSGTWSLSRWLLGKRASTEAPPAVLQPTVQMGEEK